ncbi:MAG: YifB family Mg chelatase-like AAA ATPase [Bacillota bacterium]|nr:YifB family Mg chelatase-like AAA ATPase [Bacillota bacterium]
MTVRVWSCAVLGVEGHLVEVEVDLARGLPSFDLVGLPDPAVRESRERVRAALRNLGLEFPLRRVTVNLAPAALRKEGTVFDLPVAVGIMAAMGELPPERLAGVVLAGELSLAGTVRGVPGVLAMALAVRAHLAEGVFIVPEANLPEARIVEGLAVLGVSDLAGVVRLFRAPGGLRQRAAAVRPQRQSVERPEEGGAEKPGQPGAEGEAEPDLAEVKGMRVAKRALEIAAAGRHNLLLVGPPGSGKTMLARRLPSLLPPLSQLEAVEVTKIYSIAGCLPAFSGLLRRPPFRAPHHTTTVAGLVGGGSRLRPGEASLAHRGVLFLDELAEFSRPALEALRQPLEEGVVSLARAQHTYRFPARFFLVGTCNPCPCGFYGSQVHRCSCSEREVRRYRKKLSGPLLDRIDLRVAVWPPTSQELTGPAAEEGSAAVRERIRRARALQEKRYGAPGRFNAEMGPAELRAFVPLDPAAQELLERAVLQLRLSGRRFDRVLRVARTIADLEGSARVEAGHVAEAIQYQRDPWLEGEDHAFLP